MDLAGKKKKRTNADLINKMKIKEISFRWTNIGWNSTHGSMAYERFVCERRKEGGD